MIVGSSGAALTGLQFVVIALGADHGGASEPANRAFATPTVVHFCVVLAIAGVLSAPWHEIVWPLRAVGICGVASLLYMIYVIRAARRQSSYRPVLEDFFWHWILPLSAYGTVATAGLFTSRPPRALFEVAGASLLLLFIGIHNAWDSGTYLSKKRRTK